MTDAQQTTMPSSDQGNWWKQEAGITAIEAANSLEFLEAVFAAYAAGTLFAITRIDVDPAAYGAPVTWSRHDAENRGWGRMVHNPSDSPDPAQIVFSSGTEGVPKAILLSQRNLGDVVARLNDVMQVTNQIREYVGVPVTYSFGLGRIRAICAAGGAFFLPERFDPGEIRRMLEADEINAISAVPSLWRLILDNPDVIGEAGVAVRWIEIGSQYMSASEKLELRNLFPKARIVQHYGMTEASRSTFLVISDEDNLNLLESVGPADESVRIGPEGAIEVRGDHVALGRLGADGKLVPLVRPDGWLRSSDRGEIRNNMLYFLGRLDDQMNLAGIKVGAKALETRIAVLVPEARGHFALTSISDPMRGEAVLLATEPPASCMQELVIAATTLALKEKGVRVGGALQPIALETLPRTATGKIRRAALRDSAPEVIQTITHSSKDGPAIDLSPDETRIAALWCRVLGDVPIEVLNGFYDSGGDSLSGLQVGILMESAGIPRAAINATFEGASLRDVAASLSEETAPAAAAAADISDRTHLTWSLTLTRAVVVIAVLVSHWGPGLMSVLGLPINYFVSFTRLGTPGFAMVFGIGVGLFMLPEMARAPRAVYHRADRALLLVAIGATMMTVISMIWFYTRGDPVNWLTISNAIYSVLIYYVIVLASARLWLPVLARLAAPVTALLFLALVFWLLWQGMRDILPDTQLVSPAELGRLMLGMGGYNVFKLGTMSAAGIAVGYWISTQSDLEYVRRRVLLIGGIGVLFCGASVLQAHGTVVFSQSSWRHTSLPGLGYYGSLCLLLLGVFLTLVPTWSRAGFAMRALLRLALTFGGLALPIYVSHQFVIPIYKVLQIMGVPGMIALGLPMGIFLAVMFYVGQRVFRMYRI